MQEYRHFVAKINGGPVRQVGVVPILDATCVKKKQCLITPLVQNPHTMLLIWFLDLNSCCIHRYNEPPSSHTLFN